MKRYKVIFLLFFLGFLGIDAVHSQAPQLTFRMNNPRILYTGGFNYLQFEIEIKCNQTNAFLDGSTMYISFNTTGFSETSALVTFGSHYSETNVNGDLKYSKIQSFTTFGGTRRYGIGITSPNAAGQEGGTDYLSEVYTYFHPFVTVRLRISDPAQISQVFFRQSEMNGVGAYKALGSTTPLSWFNPHLYETKDFANLYLGRLFNNINLWTQHGGTVNWSTNVNTTVWDGSATLTSADNTEALANNFRVESDASLTIPSNKWLTVSGNMTILGAVPSLVVSSGGSLIQNTPGIQATVGRTVAAWGDASHGWHLLSSPVAGQAVSPAFTDPTPGNYDFYKWSETSGLWLNQKIPGNNITTFDPGIGYLVAYQTSATKLFTGPLNVANVSGINLTKTPGVYPGGDITPGWNLLGNPFSSAVTWYNGWTLPLVTTTAKIWNEGFASYTDIAAGGIIPAMQGFMVETSGATSVTIPAAARTHNSQAWYKSSANPYIRLVAHNPGAQTAQESTVTFDAQSAPGYDPYFDSRFLPGYAPVFYSVDGAEHLSTNVLPELNSHTTVPFDFIKTTGSDYFIEAVALENFTTQVYLTDLKTSYVQTLGENPVYYFTSAEGDDPARFLLTFGPMVGSGEKTVVNNGIYTYENNLYILNPGKATLEMYSLTGQRLLKREIDNQGLFKTTICLPTAYYVVRLTTGTKVVVAKVYIKS